MGHATAARKAYIGGCWGVGGGVGPAVDNGFMWPFQKNCVSLQLGLTINFNVILIKTEI